MSLDLQRRRSRQFFEIVSVVPTSMSVTVETPRELGGRKVRTIRVIGQSKHDGTIAIQGTNRVKSTRYIDNLGQSKPPMKITILVPKGCAFEAMGSLGEIT